MYWATLNKFTVAQETFINKTFKNTPSDLQKDADLVVYFLQDFFIYTGVSFLTNFQHLAIKKCLKKWILNIFQFPGKQHGQISELPEKVY